MKKTSYPSFISAFLIVLVIFIISVLLLPQLFNPEQETGEFNAGYGSDTVKAEVVEILEEGDTLLGEIEQHYQVMEIEILEGNYAGERLRMDYGVRQIISSDQFVREGETILVTVGTRPDTGEIQAYFTDFTRSRSILILFLVFVVISVLISGWKGIRSLLGILFSLSMIIFFIIPQILNGSDPVLISIIGSFVFLSISQYLVYGWSLKTHSAVIGILISLLITGLLSALFIDFTRLTGFGDENALFLRQMAQTINMRGLLLAGMIIGALGVLDDLVISQASAVFELRAANNRLGFRFLFMRAKDIGKDHVAATVNTLVLAYAGASLPMLLLFSLSNQDPALLINISYIAEEIVRTLVGSIGLFLSVPLTTALAAYIAVNEEKYPWLQKYFGPANQWESHSHFLHDPE